MEERTTAHYVLPHFFLGATFYHISRLSNLSIRWPASLEPLSESQMPADCGCCPLRKLLIEKWRGCL